ncbi:MAG: tetratricopeptide repeat protein [Alphaproteobacteria bacterium]|nr:tetratricopeptide repeat protein [Alphaproteobacteria bacterium]
MSDSAVLANPPRAVRGLWPVSIALAAVLLLSGCAGQGGGPGQDLAFERAERIPTESGLGSYLAGRFAARALKDTTRAADFYAQALAEDVGNEYLTHRTMQLMAADGRHEEARRLAQQVMAFAPSDGLANLILAVHALKAGESASAASRMEETGRTGFNALIGPIMVAWARQDGGDPDGALAALEALKDNQAFAGFRLFHGALIADLAGRHDVAETSYKQSLTEAGGASLRGVEAYGNLLLRLARADEARQVYAAYLARNPENPGIKDLMERLDRGIVPSRPMVGGAAEGIAEALYGTAVVLSRNDRSDSGEIYVQLALFLKPDFVLARTLLADLHENDGRLDAAIHVYRTIDRASPYSWPTRLRMAWAMARSERKEEAVQLLREMAEEQPSRSDALIALGDLLRSEERFVEAVQEYDRAIQRLGPPEPRHWALFYARGIAHERSKQWAKAEADLLKALELKPDDPLVLNYLGYSWVEQGVNMERARAMIERAVKQRPNDGYIVDSLGWVLYRMGNYREAVLHLERAVELRPEDPTINDHLGDAYWKTGRHAEARFQWRRALSLKPDAAQVPIIEGKLASGLVNGQPPKPAASNNRGG